MGVLNEKMCKKEGSEGTKRLFLPLAKNLTYGSLQNLYLLNNSNATSAPNT